MIKGKNPTFHCTFLSINPRNEFFISSQITAPAVLAAWQSTSHPSQHAARVTDIIIRDRNNNYCWGSNKRCSGKWENYRRQKHVSAFLGSMKFPSSIGCLACFMIICSPVLAYWAPTMLDNKFLGSLLFQRKAQRWIETYMEAFVIKTTVLVWTLFMLD